MCDVLALGQPSALGELQNRKNIVHPIFQAVTVCLSAYVLHVVHMCPGAGYCYWNINYNNDVIAFHA